MDIRRIWLCRDVVLAEGGLPALMRVTRVAACAVIGFCGGHGLHCRNVSLPGGV